MKFHRAIGEFAGQTYSVTGEQLCARGRTRSTSPRPCPTRRRRRSSRDLMREPGWIAPRDRVDGVLTTIARRDPPQRSSPGSAARSASSLARDARSVPDLGLRGHAPADDRRRGAAAATTRFLARLSGPRVARRARRRASSRPGRVSATTPARATFDSRAHARSLREHGGRSPAIPRLCGACPGFGEYMAAAVASLAFGARVPAADANVTRVLSRLFAHRGHRRNAAPPRRGRGARGAPAAGDPRATDRRADGPRTARLHAAATPLRRLPARRGLRRPSPGSPEGYSRRVEETAPRPRLRRRRRRAAGRPGSAPRPGKVPFLDGLWEFPSRRLTARPTARRMLAAKAELLASDSDLPLGSPDTPSSTAGSSSRSSLRLPIQNPKSRIQNRRRWFTRARSFANSGDPDAHAKDRARRRAFAAGGTSGREEPLAAGAVACGASAAGEPLAALMPKGADSHGVAEATISGATRRACRWSGRAGDRALPG